MLPARVPHLLVNGAAGIAVGIATKIPPHNLREVVAGLTALIHNPDITIAQLTQHIPGPDFPTGMTFGHTHWPAYMIMSLLSLLASHSSVPTHVFSDCCMLLDLDAVIRSTWDPDITRHGRMWCGLSMCVVTMEGPDSRLVLLCNDTLS